MMLWATVLARTDVVLHAAGWLEGGLTASFEKLALDVELLEQFARGAQGIGFTDEELAFDALKEVGPGGLYLASPHTMAHFREWLFMSPLFTTPDVATWEAMGAPDARQRALESWKRLLGSYEDPGIDPVVDEELRAFVERRKQDPPEPED
jgi:trimethylamine--corrinoid protein Co-methyltransferase